MTALTYFKLHWHRIVGIMMAIAAFVLMLRGEFFDALCALFLGLIVLHGVEFSRIRTELAAIRARLKL